MGFEETVGAERPSRFPAAFVLGLIIVAIVFGTLGLLLHFTHKQAVDATAKPFPFGPAEQAYAKGIHFDSIQMATANNMLNQQFTYVAGTVENAGAQSVAGLDVTIEFSDPFKQIILRQSERLIGPKDAPLAAGEKRDFQVTIEQAVPDTWDHQYPAFHVTGLVLH